MTDPIDEVVEVPIDDKHRHHHHHEKAKLEVIAKFPTAMANKENDPPEDEQHWWISDDTGAVLSEQYVAYPTEEDAWAAAYMVSVKGVTREQIAIAANLNWCDRGKPMGDIDGQVADWFKAIDEFEL